MAVGLGSETLYYLEAKVIGRTKRTVRTVLETRRNLIPDPDVSDVSKWRTSADLSSVVEDGHTALFIKARPAGGFYIDPNQSFGVNDYGFEAGDVLKISAWVKTTTTLRLRVRTSGYSGASTGTYSDYVEVSPGDGWVLLESEETITEAPAGGSFRILLWPATLPGGAGYYVRGFGAEVNTNGPAFSGNTPNAGGWEYRWEGAPNNSVSIAERVKYAEVWDDISEGAPRVRLTVYNVPDGSTLELRWSAGGESGPVQGHRVWRVSGVGVATDWAAPLGREITYSVVVDGVVQSSATVTLLSESAWIQDPLHPDQGIPVSSTQLKPGYLMFDSKAISSASYANSGASARVMGSNLPRYSAGQRSAASGVSVTMWSDDEPTETAFRQMVMDAPVLLIRALPKHRLLPPVAYIAADVSEDQRTVRLGQDLVHWTVAGDLVHAVLRAALSGHITYQQVQDLLGGYTYGEVQEAARATTYLDWQKHPLIFMDL